MNDKPMTHEEILAVVAGFIREVILEEWAADAPIGMETSFARDLELESIEFVDLASRIQERFGRQADFTAWLSGMELDEIIGLQVGQVVEFIAQCQSRP